MGFFVNDEKLLGEVNIIFSEAVDVSSNDKRLKGLYLYLRTAKEASYSSISDFEKHGPSFKVSDGVNYIATVTILNKKGKIKIIGKENLKDRSQNYLEKFSTDNQDLIKMLWNSTKGTDEYNSIIKEFEKRNPKCKFEKDQ